MTFDATPNTSATHGEPAALLPETRRALLHRVATGQAEGRAPSLVGAVARDGGPVWARGRGFVDGSPPDGDTQYRIGSLTKTFVAVTVLRLRDEGLLDLGDPLGEHLPGTGVGQVTVRQLLSHTAGLAAETPGPWWERTPGGLRPELGDLLGEEPARHPAGQRFHYSNPGYALLGALVERLRGAPWDEVLRREVLRPLGMGRTCAEPGPGHARGWAVHPWADAVLAEEVQRTGRMAPAGELWSTAEDLCRWAVFLMDGHEEVLAADTLAEMREPAAPPGGPDWVTGYGLGLGLARIDGRTLIGHGGSMPGFLATLWASPEEGLAAVALANCTSGPAVSAVAADLLRIVAEREPRIPEPWTPSRGLDTGLLELTGPWYWGTTPYLLTLRGARDLELTPVGEAGSRGSRFSARDDGTWTGLDGYHAGEVLRVVRRPDGPVSHLDLGSFVFTREPYRPEDAVPGGVDPRGWRGRE
ncbi:serine hydrolase domain-containing protein [Streptomyces capparidis]